MDPYSSDFDPNGLANALMGISALFSFFGWLAIAVPNAILCSMLAETKGRGTGWGFFAGLLFFPWSTLYYLGAAPAPRQPPTSDSGYKGTPAPL